LHEASTALGSILKGILDKHLLLVALVVNLQSFEFDFEFDLSLGS
jgi:hypothetical protein